MNPPAFGPEHVGRRVTVRSLLPDGRATDVVGVLEEAGDPLVVRDRSGARHRIERANVVAARVVHERR